VKEAKEDHREARTLINTRRIALIELTQESGSIASIDRSGEADSIDSSDESTRRVLTGEATRIEEEKIIQVTTP